MSDSRIFATMRQMAWERAKGELKSIEATFWDSEEKYEEFNRLLEEFVNAVESSGVAE